MKTQENNHISLVGKIEKTKPAYKRLGETFYYIYLKVERKSGNFDRIPVIVSEYLADMSQDYTGEYILIEGQFRSRNYTEGGKRRLELFAFAQELRFIETEIPEDKINAVHLCGFLCKAPVLRQTPNGRNVCDLLIVVSRPCGISDYIPCIAWEREAKRAARMKVGDMLEFTGRAQSRPYRKVIDGLAVTLTAYEISIGMILD